VGDRLGTGTAIIFTSFDSCRSWCGQILCGITVVSALTKSKDPWFSGADVAWELENPVPCERGVRAKGALGLWKVGEEVREKVVRALLR